MYIWWLNEADHRAIETLSETKFPEYLCDQFVNMEGRPLRGRLWADDQFGSVGVDPWPDTLLAKVFGKDYGGIVILEVDYDLVKDLPGIVTDTKLKRLN